MSRYQPRLRRVRSTDFRDSLRPTVGVRAEERILRFAADCASNHFTRSPSVEKHLVSRCLSAVLWHGLAVGLGCRDPGPPLQTLPAGNNPGSVAWVSTVAGSAGRVAFDTRSVYFPGRNHEVIAVDRMSGALAWRARVVASGSVPIGQATVVAGPVVVYPDAALHAFDRTDGTLRWVFEGEEGSLPGLAVPASSSGKVLAGSYSGVVYAVTDSTGALEWRLPAPVDYNASAYDPVADGAQVFVGYAERAPGSRGGIGAIDLFTGQLLWLFDLTVFASGPLSSTRCLGSFVVDPTSVYAWTEQGDLVALDRTNGGLKWVVPILGAATGINHRYSALANGTLVVGALDGHLEGRAPESGALLWSHELTRGSIYAPLARDSTSVYVPIAGGSLAAVAAESGTLRWMISSVTSSLGLFGVPGVDSQHVYIGGTDALFAIRK